MFRILVEKCRERLAVLSMWQADIALHNAQQRLIDAQEELRWAKMDDEIKTTLRRQSIQSYAIAMRRLDVARFKRAWS